MRQMIRSLIVHAAREVHECCNRAEAFAAYSAHHPDRVLMGVAMPGVDGITAKS